MSKKIPLLKIITAHSASCLESNFKLWSNKENVTVISTSLVINSGYHLSVVYTEN